jgi:hypothetical protein
MPIEFRCPNCEQLLRVPEDAAGKNARCPKCGALATIPFPAAAPGAPLPAPLTPANPPPPMPPPPEYPPASPFGDAARPAGGNPFAIDPPTKPSLNPYASPGASYTPTTFAAPIGHQRVEIGDIWNYAWQIWQNNLGLLIGVSVVATIINNVVGVPFWGVQMILQLNDAPEAAAGVYFLSIAVNMVVQTFLNIGQIQIALKLARRQHAEFTDLFAGGSRLLPALGITLLTILPIIIACGLLIVPGIILLLMFWPCYLLVIDEKARVFDSFSIAYNITEDNRMTSFLMWLLGLCIMFVGFLACCVGVLATAPLFTMMSVTAYLMMSGQLPVPRMPGEVAGYATPAQQQPAKW